MYYILLTQCDISKQQYCWRCGNQNFPPWQDTWFHLRQLRTLLRLLPKPAGQLNSMFIWKTILRRQCLQTTSTIKKLIFVRVCFKSTEALELRLQNFFIILCINFLHMVCVKPQKWDLGYFTSWYTIRRFLWKHTLFLCHQFHIYDARINWQVSPFFKVHLCAGTVTLHAQPG